MTLIKFGKTQYVWHLNRPDSYPGPGGPPVMTTVNGGGGMPYTLPPASLVILRGVIH